jgi:nicotinate-nucleotide adenylyltransferase
VRELKRSYSKIYIVIGADNLNSLKRWYKYDALKEEVTFIVAKRSNIQIPTNMVTLNINKDISSSQLRNHIDISMLPKQNAKQIETYYKEHNAK